MNETQTIHTRGGGSVVKAAMSTAHRQPRAAGAISRRLAVHAAAF